MLRQREMLIPVFLIVVLIASAIFGARTASAQSPTVAPPQVALDFDGIDDRVETPPIELTDDFTISFWVNARTTKDQQIFVNKNGKNGQNFTNQVVIGYESGNYIVTFGPNGDDRFAPRDEIKKITGWQHLTLVGNSDPNEGRTLLTLYRNAQIIGGPWSSTSSLSKIGTGISWTFGYAIPDTKYRFVFDGKMAGIALWNTAKTSEEVARIYREGASASSGGLAAHWPMNEGSGDTVADVSGHGHNALLGGSGGPQQNPIWVRAPQIVDQPFSCDNSPVGRIVPLGSDSEVFVNFTSTQAGVQTAIGYNHTDAGWLEGTIQQEASSVSSFAATMADLRGDGRSAFVQANSNGVTVHWPDAPSTRWEEINDSARHVSIAAGNLDRRPGHSDELVRAQMSNYPHPGQPPYTDTVLRIYTLNRMGNDLEKTGFWWSSRNDRGLVKETRVAAADLDGNGHTDKIVVAVWKQTGDLELIVLEYDKGHERGDSIGAFREWHIREIASLQESNLLASAKNFDLAIGDVDGDFKDEIILAWDVSGGSAFNHMSTHRWVRTYDFDAGDWARSPAITEAATWLEEQVLSEEIALGAGDLNRDGIDEIVLGYRRTSGPTLGLALTILKAPGSGSTLTVHERWPRQNDSGVPTHGLLEPLYDLALAVGDLDSDGRADIVTSQRDAQGQMQILYFTDNGTMTAPKLQAMQIRTVANGPYNNISVHMGDWDGDSFRFVYDTLPGATSSCAEMTEPQVSAAIFMPPYWQNITNKYPEGTENILGRLGRSETQGGGEEYSTSVENNHTVSAYIGGGIASDIGGATIKATYERQWGRSSTKTSGSATSEEVVGYQANAASFVIYDESLYHCYTYQLNQGSAAADGVARFCKFQKMLSKNRNPDLGTWDSERNQRSNQWIPIVRDWANLALFRGADTQQSSTPVGANSAFVVDGQIGEDDGEDGNGLENMSTTFTDREQSPWWQVDLRRSEPISKIRVWNRNGSDCAAQRQNPAEACPEDLTDFYVFVSDTPFTSNDPTQLAAAPNVHVYFHAGMGNKVTTLQTLQNRQPIRGRYVRVQLKNEGLLSLDEVQIFGPHHVEPHRYPKSLAYDEANRQIKLTIYDKATQSWQETAIDGVLVWDGGSELTTQVVGTGGGIQGWSYTQTQEWYTSQVTTTSSSTSVGSEFDAEVGYIGKIQFGGGYQYTTGIGHEEARTISLGQSFEIGAEVKGFPPSYQGVNITWPKQCEYTIKPYYYWKREISDTGYSHFFLVVDYIVLADRLDRTHDLSDCEVGRYDDGLNRLYLPATFR